MSSWKPVVGHARRVVVKVGSSTLAEIGLDPLMRTLHALRERGLEVSELVPLVVGVGEFNEGYLDAKRDRMGHALPDHAGLDAARLERLHDEELQSAAEGNS